MALTSCSKVDPRLVGTWENSQEVIAKNEKYFRTTFHHFTKDGNFINITRNSRTMPEIQRQELRPPFHCPMNISPQRWGKDGVNYNWMKAKKEKWGVKSNKLIFNDLEMTIKAVSENKLILEFYGEQIFLYKSTDETSSIIKRMINETP